MSDPQKFFIEFEVKDEARFHSLYHAFEALKEDKRKQIQAQNEEERIHAFRSDTQWLALFDERSRTYFRWSTKEEDDAWLFRWLATPVEKRLSDPALQRQWSLLSMIEAFQTGEFELLSCQIVSLNQARLEYNPLAEPFGGTDCMKALIEAFGFHVLKEKREDHYIQQLL
ncbi:MAG: hypothetical protein WCD86_05100 [Ktedonobacteraceae bacterium]